MLFFSLWISCSLVTLPSVHNPRLNQLYWGGLLQNHGFFPIILCTYINWHYFCKEKFFFSSFTFLFVIHIFIYSNCYTKLYNEYTQCSSCPKLGQWESPSSWLFCLSASFLSGIRYTRFTLFFLCFRPGISHFSKKPIFLSVRNVILKLVSEYINWASCY